MSAEEEDRLRRGLEILRKDIELLTEMTRCEEPFALVQEARREMEERERERDEAHAVISQLRADRENTVYQVTHDDRVTWSKSEVLRLLGSDGDDP